MKPELRKNEHNNLYRMGFYVVAYKTVYQVTKTGMLKVYYHNHSLPLTKRGRFHSMGFGAVNKLVGFELLTR